MSTIYRGLILLTTTGAYVYKGSYQSHVGSMPYYTLTTELDTATIFNAREASDIMTTGKRQVKLHNGEVVAVSAVDAYLKKEICIGIPQAEKE